MIKTRVTTAREGEGPAGEAAEEDQENDDQRTQSREEELRKRANGLREEYADFLDHKEGTWPNVLCMHRTGTMYGGGWVKRDVPLWCHFIRTVIRAKERFNFLNANLKRRPKQYKTQPAQLTASGPPTRLFAQRSNSNADLMNV
jgi:hypothetical protein